MSESIPEPNTEMPESAVTIGIFDGVHRGHQALLAETVAAAERLGVVSAALTFDPHPSALFAPARMPLLLGTIDERIALLQRYGAARVQVIPFDGVLSRQTPDEFIREVLLDRLKARAVIVGDDFRFGCDRRGDVTYLRQAGERLGFQTIVVPPVFVDGVPARSTAIRQMIYGGQIASAERLLGRPYSLSGTVVHGRQLGRTIGFPTANLETAPGILVPGAGVYAGRAVRADGRSHTAAISIGTNPTVTPGQEAPRTVEAFLLNFDGDLYGEALRFEFRHFLRGTEKFPSLDALVEQMHRDVAETDRLISGA